MIPEADRHSIGSPATDLGEGILATIVQIIAMASRQIVCGHLVHADWHEDRISDVLRNEMVQAKRFLETKRGTELTLRIQPPQFEVQHTEKGRIDLAVTYSPDEDEYFAIECKRLSGRRRGLDQKYVTDGMMRFVTGKYSRGHRWGMMVGYVISGTCEQAIQFVAGRICQHQSYLQTEREFAVETRFSEYPFLYSSDHRQETTRVVMTLLHFFFRLP